MTRTEPPAGIEHKGGPAVLAPRAGAPSTGAGSIAPEGVVELIAAVTGGEPDAAGDILVPGCFARTTSGRGPRPKICTGHDWTKAIGRVLDIRELRPGDPGLHARTGDGRPWPAACGALIITAQLNLSTTGGHDAFEQVKFFGPEESCWSIGYKVTPDGARKRGGIRYITDLDVYEASLVLHGAHPLARGLSVKSVAGLPERKATPAGVGTVGPHRVIACDLCGRPTAAIAGGPPPGLSLVCSRCVADSRDTAGRGHLGEDHLGDVDDLDAYLRDAEDLEPDITAEDAYHQAREEEVHWQMAPDGELIREGETAPAEREGLAWRQHGRRSRYQA